MFSKTNNLLNALYLMYPMAKKKTKKVQVDEPKKEIRKPVRAILAKERVLTEVSDDARELYNQSRYGSLLEGGKLQLSLLESLYLIEKKKLLVVDGRNTEISFDKFIKKAQKEEPNFWIRFCVFRDIRNRGYIIKTALKFGADFRVYDRGVKPGEDHAKWVI